MFGVKFLENAFAPGAYIRINTVLVIKHFEGLYYIFCVPRYESVDRKIGFLKNVRVLCLSFYLITDYREMNTFFQFLRTM